MISLPPFEPVPDQGQSACPFLRGSLPPSEEPRLPAPGAHSIEVEAHRYLELMHREGAISGADFGKRLDEIRSSVAEQGSYWQTEEELEFGSRVAWRNSARCIGRLYWQKLKVRDLRHLHTEAEIFEALVEHIRIATNAGKIQSVISIFAPPEPGTPGIRIWNPQLIRYAGYRRSDGSVLGDPANVEFTEVCRRLGWQGGEGTPFDLLPLVIQMPGKRPVLFELPRDVVLEVPITHPNYPWFEEMGLKWHAVPVISGMRMEIGGISYTAAPFNGWYMGTEIGARNFADEQRYDMLPWVARVIGLDTRSNRALWRDRALVELNVAVLHSFHKNGVTIIDHHSASKHFVRHEEYERQADRTVPGDWGWLVPPISGSASPLFHREYHDTLLKPNYFYQPNPWTDLMPGVVPQPAPEEMERSERDLLTGLLHRGALDTRLVSFRSQGGAVLLIDLDRFAKVNRDHGEVAGNAVLRQIGRVLLSVLRPDDDCARSGGDEFCVLLNGVETEEDALRVAERIRDALLGMYVEGAPQVRVRMSMGLSLVSPPGEGTEAVRQAARALKAAKEAGRGRIALARAAG